MAAPIEIRSRAIALLEQLPGESLVKAVEFLEALSHEAVNVSQAPLDGSSETALLQIIQKRLSPEDQDRLNYLRSRSEAGEITETEHHELLMYIERVEEQDAKRAEALIQLAKLRNVDLKMLIDEFLPTKRNVV
jgi:hypothetical protein